MQYLVGHSSSAPGGHSSSSSAPLHSPKGTARFYLTCRRRAQARWPHNRCNHVVREFLACPSSLPPPPNLSASPTGSSGSSMVCVCVCACVRARDGVQVTMADPRAKWTKGAQPVSTNTELVFPSGRPTPNLPPPPPYRLSSRLSLCVSVSLVRKTAVITDGKKAWPPAFILATTPAG